VLTGCFAKSGPAFSTGKQTLHLQLTALGRAGHLRPITLTRTAPKANRIVYRGQHIAEWWRVLPLGYEQGFTLNQVPAGNGKVVLQLSASRAPKIVHGTLAWGKLRYGKLHVTDATGRILSATLSAQGRTITLAFDARHARYPIIVDPLVWLQQEITASDGGAGYYFGSSVAISGDGATALVGSSGKNNGQGVAYIFTRSNGTWKEIGELAPGDGEANEHFGSALTLSTDGSTALVGAWNKTVNGNAEQGAAYIFTTSDDWVTHTQAAELTARDGGMWDDFGNSVALSADGTTAVVGSPFGGNIDQGVAYVFATPDGWTTHTQTTELTASDLYAGDAFGQTVSLSDDGATALVGAPGRAINGNLEQGAAYLYTLNNSSWTQAAELTANDGVAEDSFGGRVALSADGAMALIAAYEKNDFQGAAYVFTTSDGWTTNTQAAKLTASNGEKDDRFGWDVALSDNATALVGSPSANVDGNIGQGAAYVFTESSGVWTQADELTESDGVAYDGFASTVAFSSDGATMLMGSGCHPYDQGTATCGPGAAYLFNPSTLSAALNVPATVQAGAQFSSQYILTNAGTTASAALVVSLPLPATNAGYVSVSASQGTCSYDSTAKVATCAVGSISGNGGTVSATLNLKAAGAGGATIAQSGQLANASPNLVQTANTTIQLPPVPTVSGLSNVAVTAPTAGTEAFTLAGTGTLTVTATSSNTTLLPNTNITGASACTQTGSCTLTLTPAAGQSGTATVTIAVSDSYGQSGSDTFGLTVKAAPAPPSGGGGALGPWALLGLLGLALLIGLARRQIRD